MKWLLRTKWAFWACASLSVWIIMVFIKVCFFLNYQVIKDKTHSCSLFFHAFWPIIESARLLYLPKTMTKTPFNAIKNGRPINGTAIPFSERPPDKAFYSSGLSPKWIPYWDALRQIVVWLDPKERAALRRLPYLVKYFWIICFSNSSTSCLRLTGL